MAATTRVLKRLGEINSKQEADLYLRESGSQGASFPRVGDGCQVAESAPSLTKPDFLGAIGH